MTRRRKPHPETPSRAIAPFGAQRNACIRHRCVRQAPLDRVEALVFSCFREPLAFGFGSKRKRHESDQEHRAERDSRISQWHRLRIAGEHFACEQTQREWPKRSDESSDVVAERCSRATQARGKQFWKVDRVSREQR